MIDIALRVPLAAIERSGLDTPTRSDAALSQVVNALGSSNVALASAGAVASASSTCSTAYPVAAVNDSERADVNWGNGGGWAGGTNPPDWVVTRVLDQAAQVRGLPAAIRADLL